MISVPQGSMGKILQAARRTLGITLNGDFVDLGEKFAEQAVRLGIPPLPTPATAGSTVLLHPPIIVPTFSGGFPYCPKK